MKTFSLLLLTACLALICGCGEEEDFSRYPSVWIPEYATADYIRDLSSPDAELVYNATCNLGRRSGEFSKTLCAEDADPDSPEYKTAEEVYRRIRSQLGSKEEYTVAATLRFLQYFAKEYEPKEELIKLVSQVESDHPQVQFEQVTLLTNHATEDTRLPDPLLLRLMDSPSWVVSRTAYLLIGEVGQEALRMELVRRYRNTDDERERLIIITALDQHLKPNEARLFEQEMITTDNPKIRRATGAALVNNVHCPGVKDWLMDHYAQFSEVEKKRMFDDCEDEDLSLWFVTQGFIPADDTLEIMAEGLLSDDEEFRAIMARFEVAMQANPQMVMRWTAVKEKVKREAEQRATFEKEITPAVDEFIDAVKLAVIKTDLSAAEQKKLVKELIDSSLASWADAE